MKKKGGKRSLYLQLLNKKFLRIMPVGRKPCHVLLLLVVIAVAAVHGTYDLPLKQCPGMKVAEPSWMLGQDYGYGDLYNVCYETLADVFDSSTRCLATLQAPYTVIDPGTKAGYMSLRKKKITTNFGGVLDLSTLYISFNQTHCLGGKGDTGYGVQQIKPSDMVTSATILGGGRNVLLTTDGSQYGSQVR